MGVRGKAGSPFPQKGFPPSPETQPRASKGDFFLHRDAQMRRDYFTMEIFLPPWRADW